MFKAIIRKIYSIGLYTVNISVILSLWPLRKNTIFLRVKISFVVKRIARDVLLFFTEFCLYNKQKNTWVLGNI